jgi:hypothetical protein
MVHQTVRSGAQAGVLDELAALRKSWSSRDYNLSDCLVIQPCPRQRSAAQSDCPMCQGGRGCNGRLRQKRKGITHRSLFGGAPNSLVRPWTEGNYCLSNEALTAPSCLRAIKGPPRRMEKYTKHLLNILRRLDSTSTHSIHCV